MCARRQRLTEVRDWSLTIAETTGRAHYDRVVIVAHSLGTVIGYDLIQQYWEKRRADAS